ncbi:unnamed protein product [Ectocarpus sp. CCAP 1310/34]|nr:unnamed protein product [Ectocarpus sp. CCAP 1310/34]
MEHGSLNASMLKGYHSKWDTWTAERAKANLSPWLYEEDGVDSAVRELTVFMASRCLVYKNQSQTVKGYLAAIKYFHKQYAGWELPTSHFRVVAVGNAVERLHARAETTPLVRQPLTVPMIIAGRERAQTNAFGLQGRGWGSLSHISCCAERLSYGPTGTA